jgi:hypothetical protein
MKWFLLFLLMTMVGFGMAFYALYRQDRNEFMVGGWACIEGVLSCVQSSCGVCDVCARCFEKQETDTSRPALLTDTGLCQLVALLLLDVLLPAGHV